MLQFSTTMMPNWIGSMPMEVAMGSRMGVAIRIKTMDNVLTHSLNSSQTPFQSRPLLLDDPMLHDSRETLLYMLQHRLRLEQEVLIEDAR